LVGFEYGKGGVPLGTPPFLFGQQLEGGVIRCPWFTRRKWPYYPQVSGLDAENRIHLAAVAKGT
jgi:hypothetical protein